MLESPIKHASSEHLNVGLVTGGEAEGPGPLSHVPIPLQVQRVDLDQNQLLHLSESLFRGDRVHHLHQRQRQVSRLLLCHVTPPPVVKYPVFERSPVCSSCTHHTAPLIVPSPTDHFLPTSHLSAPIADCGALEIHHRTPSPPSPPRGVRCPPLWARAAQTAPLQFSAPGRWPPGETGLVCLSWEIRGFFTGDYYRLPSFQFHFHLSLGVVLSSVGFVSAPPHRR